MSTSVKDMRKHLLYNLGGTLFLAFAGAVYEHFSHGVYSYWMIYAFAFPLVMGVVPYTLLLMREKYPNRIFLNLWNSAIATLSVWSVMKGVLAIAGYTNSLIVVYPVVGVALALTAVVSVLMDLRREPAPEAERHDDTAV